MRVTMRRMRMTSISRTGMTMRINFFPIIIIIIIIILTLYYHHHCFCCIFVLLFLVVTMINAGIYVSFTTFAGPGSDGDDTIHKNEDNIINELIG